jgi:hypothetical protein
LCHCCITPGANESFIRRCGSLRPSAKPGRNRQTRTAGSSRLE